jgi:hypothetical protein
MPCWSCRGVAVEQPGPVIVAHPVGWQAIRADASPRTGVYEVLGTR